MTKNCLIVLLFLSVLLHSCFRDKSPELLPQQKTLFTLQESSHTGISFSNDIDDTSHINYYTSSYIYNGGGVAVGDLNNDGLPDIVLTGNQVEGKIYLNNGNFRFTDVTLSSGFSTAGGWTTGVTVSDVNGDGWLDIYVCKAVSEDPSDRANLLFINQQNLTFSEEAKQYGLDDTTHSIHANFFDMDNDGDLDVYILEYPHNFEIVMEMQLMAEKPEKPVQGVDRLLRNDNGKFVDVTMQSGIVPYYGYGLSVTASDVNYDGLVDLFVANDYLTPDRLLINKGSGIFEDQSEKYFDKISFFSMGADFGDMNNDQQPDLFVVDMAPIDNYRQKMNILPMSVEFYNVMDHFGIRRQYFRNMLHLKTDGGFSEVGELAGVAKTDWSWGAIFGDWDNDGFQDLYVAKGTKRDLDNLDYMRLLFPDNPGEESKHRHDKGNIIQGMKEFRDHNYVFRNNGNLTFETKMKEWGMSQQAASNSCAYADLDNDGDLDVVVNNTDIPAFVYMNNEQELNKNNWLRIKLTGDNKNTDGIGAKCYLFTGSQKMVREMTPVRGYQSCSEMVMHFGLGNESMVDSIIVEWPGGKSERRYKVVANQEFTCRQSEAVKAPLFDPVPPVNELVKTQHLLDVPFVHQESSFNDFKRDRLLHRKYSMEGPGMASGDLNGDGLDDVFIGGAAGQKSVVYYQTVDGKFTQQLLWGNLNDSLYEITGALIIDINNDGFNDLVTTSCSNEFEFGSNWSGALIYMNDGKGKMIFSPDMLPGFHSCVSSVTACDFDGDGFKDLFVGGRISPGLYPSTPVSYLLKNEEGKRFIDVTDKLAKGLSKVGMVTSSLWTDYDNDGWMDLVVVGEWMPITLYKNNGGQRLEKQNIPSLEKSNGWWNSIHGADFDDDGDTDYILGNWGANCVIKATEKEPVSMYAADFDNNGSIDPLLFYYIQGVNSPFANRDMLCEKMPVFFNKFNTYESYAKAGPHQILSSAQMQKADKLTAYILSNCYLENKGNGVFELRALPLAVQAAPVLGLLIEDFDRDGKLDVLMSGNSYTFYVDQGNMDAGRGAMLKGDGAGNFEVYAYRDCGFVAAKDARALVGVHLPGKGLGIFQANNNSAVQTFVLPHPENAVRVLPSVTTASIVLKGGKKRKLEFYDGSGYLGQSSRITFLPIGAVWVEKQVLGKK